jgi:hypothetical protein
VPCTTEISDKNINPTSETTDSIKIVAATIEELEASPDQITADMSKPKTDEFVLHNHPSPAAPSVTLKPPPESEDNEFFTPMKPHEKIEGKLTKIGSMIETTPLSTNEPSSGAKNLRELIYSPSLTSAKTSSRKRRSSVTSEEAKDAASKAHRASLSVPSQRRRRASEGDNPNCAVPVPYQYKWCPTSARAGDHARNMQLNEHSVLL